MATSAQRIRPMLSVASPGAAAMPMLALIRTLTPLRMNGCSSSAVSRRARPAAYGGSLSMSRAPSSSPPMRTSTSVERSELMSRGPSCLQQLVPGGVAEGVVDLLEMVQVDEQERQAARRRRRIGKVVEVRVEHGRELTAVAEPGELVGHCLAVAFLGQRAQPAYRQTQAQPDHDQGGCREGHGDLVHVVLERAHEEDHQARERPTSRKQEARELAGLEQVATTRRHPYRDRHQGDGGRPGDAVEDDPDLLDVPRWSPKRLNVSPMPFTAHAVAKSSQGRRRPGRIAVPPTTRASSRTSPIG